MSSLQTLQKGNLTPAVSYVKITVIFIAIAVVAVACVVGFILYQNSLNAPILEHQVEEVSSHYPEGFYPSFRPKELKEKSNQEDAKEQAASITVVTANGLQQGQNGQVQATETSTVQKVEKSTQQLTPLTEEEKALKAQLAQLKALQDQRRVTLLARRGNKSSDWAVVESIPTIEGRNKPTPEVPSDKDFSEQEIDKDVSTFPVDLSRVVTADRNIPCILIDQINSQIEGKVTCSVERNVFGFHGRNILVPAGTRFIGEHGTLKKVGDERFNITWKRGLRPDGVHFSLTDAYASDAIGGTGVEGVVNRRNWEKYGGAILTSTVSVLAQMSIPSEGTNISNSVFESFSTDLGRVTAAMLNENINIKPYSVVPAGERILIKPTTDIWLKKEGEKLSFEAVEPSQLN